MVTPTRLKPAGERVGMILDNRRDFEVRRGREGIHSFLPWVLGQRRMDR
jgi:hypothetical protein